MAMLRLDRLDCSQLKRLRNCNFVVAAVAVGHCAVVIDKFEVRAAGYLAFVNDAAAIECADDFVADLKIVGDNFVAAVVEIEIELEPMVEQCYVD